MLTAESVFCDVAERAENIRNDDERAIDVMDVGDQVRQGDIYLTMIDRVPPLAKKVKKPDSQLAPGSTQGSRHCLRRLDRVTVYQMTDPGPLDGPVLDAPCGLTVDHPEHGNRTLPAGIYAVTYQRAFADEIRRVAD